MSVARLVAAVATAFACLFAVPALAQQAAAPPSPDYSWQDAIPRQTGTVELPGGDASLVLGDDYYFIDAAGARKVLIDGWNNPPDVVDGVLGMIFPKRFKPMDDASWGGVITFNESGWVSDKDAAKTDYNKLLKSLREGEDEQNRERQKQGYPTINLVGWAERPSYNPANHVAIWARELAFNSGPDHGLNYDIRVLGRTGVLSINVVAGMGDLADVHAAAGQISRTVAFKSGSTYGDYQPGVDKAAGYGIAGLIAAGAGVAAVKKLGLLGIILAFGKKFIVIIVAAFGGVAAWFRRQFGGKGVVGAASGSGAGGAARPSLFDGDSAGEKPETPRSGDNDIVT